MTNVKASEREKILELIVEKLGGWITTAKQPTAKNKIDRSKATLFEVGSALRELHSPEVYIFVSPSWSALCEEYLGKSRQYVGNLMNAAEVIEGIGRYMPHCVPVLEAQCRPLVGYHPVEQAAVWCRALLEAGLIEPGWQTSFKLTEKGQAEHALFEVQGRQVTQAIQPEVLQSDMVLKAVQAFKGTLIFEGTCIVE